MPNLAAFLRGMNLGKRRVTNVELCGHFEALGLREVTAFLSSGNVAFTAEGTSKSLEKRLEAGLLEALGYPVPSFVRSAGEVLAVAAARPFADRKGHSARGKLQVAFLRRKPSPATLAALQQLETHEDWLSVEGRELYWWPVGGLSESELDLRPVAEGLGPMTVRTKQTIERMATKYFTNAATRTRKKRTKRI